MISIRVVSALAVALTGLCGLPLAAQTLSAADILAKVEEKVGGVNEYQALLNDPEPARSMAAMEVMLESGDPKLVRMALDFGLFSPNEVVQRTALQGFFETKPTLSIYLTGEDAAAEEYYRSTIEGYLKGSVNSSSVGFFVMQLGEYDEKTKCYASPFRNTACAIYLSDAGVSLEIMDQKGSLTLNDEGELVGEIKLYNVKSPVTLRIPVSF